MVNDLIRAVIKSIKKVIFVFIKIQLYHHWKKRFRKIYHFHPEYKRPIKKKTEKEHIQTWKVLDPLIRLDTLRVCSNISGKQNYLIVPEEIYATCIEPCLNDHNTVKYLENKSVYERWYGKGIFPQTYFHNINEQFLDDTYSFLSPQNLDELIDHITFPCVIKPNVDSYGGKNIYFPKNKTELYSKLKGKNNYVVQEKIIQHPFFERLNPFGLNTLRVCLYRSVKNNELHVLNVALRMGKGGSLDNETQGGIVCYINKNGALNPYAVDKFGKKFFSHPDTGIKFSECEKIPCLDNMLQLSKKIASSLYLSRLISLDLCYDVHEDWRVIEINLFGQTIRFSQYAGHQYFGEFTHEVIEYCKDKDWWESKKVW